MSFIGSESLMKLTIEGTPEEIRTWQEAQMPTNPVPQTAIRGTHWSAEELAVIKGAPTWYIAWDQYREKFPGFARSREAIRVKFLELHPKDKPADGLPTETPPRSQGGDGRAR